MSELHGSGIGDQIEGKLKGAVVNALMSILVSMIRPLATLTEVFFRHNMGERYFTAWNLIVGLFLLVLCGFPYGAILIGNGRYDMYGQYHSKEWGSQEWAPMLVFIVWVVVFGFCAKLHQSAVIERYKKGIRWHSVCVGIPRFPEVPEFVEKLVPIVGGVLLIWPTRLYGLGALMILSGITSVILRAYEAAKFRERMLDLIDSQIEQENLVKAVNDRLTPEKTEGFQAPLPAYVSDAYRGKLFRRLGKQAIRPPCQINALAAAIIVCLGDGRYLTSLTVHENRDNISSLSVS